MRVDRDENGFSLNFDGALARIKKRTRLLFYIPQGQLYSRLCRVKG